MGKVWPGVREPALYRELLQVSGGTPVLRGAGER